MGNQIRVGQFTQDGGLVNLPLGFIPDYIELANRDLTNTVFIEWWHLMQTNDISGSQEGISIDAAGVPTDLGDAAGITAYNASSQRPQIGIWEASNTTVDTRDGTTLTVVARTATAPGTYVNPTVSSSADRGAIFECVTAGTTGSTEPTWPDSIGENVTDNSMVWKRVDKSLQRGGYQGVIIAAAVQTNGQLMYYLAIQSDQSVVHGDVDGWTDGIDPDA